MNFSDILKALNQASAFELRRLRAAINRVLDEPRWLLAIQSRLRIGETVEYFDSQANALRRELVLELRRKQAVILDQDDRRRWLIPYVAINLDGADARIREQPRQGLGRNEVAMGGGLLGFVDGNQQQRMGRVNRLNDKTVTLLCGSQQWRVAYCFLHRVVDSAAVEQNVPERDMRLAGRK